MTTLGEIGTYLNGRGFKKAEWSKSGRPIIRIQNLTGTNSTFNYYAGEADDAYIARPGDVLISWAATLGVYVWRGPEAVVNQHIFKVESHIDRDFHRYFVMSALGDLQRETHGSGMVHITRKRFDAIPVPLPPLAEQRRIVAAIEEQFSRLDAAGQSLVDARRRIEALRARAYSHAVQAGDDLALGELLDGIEAGKSFKCDGRPAEPDEWGVIKVSAMTWGEFDASENKGVTDPSRVDPRWEIRPGDLLLSRANTSELVGASVLVGECRARLLLSDKSMRLLVKAGVEKSWLRMALGSREVRSQISVVATGTSDSMRNISQQKVKELRLRVPRHDEQRRIVAEIEQQLSLIDALSAAVESAQKRSAALRRAILERAFRGELVPQDPADEPASVLLERIRAERAAAPKPSRRRATMKAP
jgi:type I restriction enzyme, S subunit